MFLLSILDIITGGFQYSIGLILGAIANFIIDSLVALINGILTNQGFQQAFTGATTGDLSGLCSGQTDCGGANLAMKIAPYAEFLGLCCWGYAVLKSIDDMTQAELLQLMFHVRRGLVMMFGVWFIYPVARMVWEMCRVTSNAMVFDINGGASQFGSSINLPLSQATFNQFGTAWVNLAYAVLMLIEVAFLVVWMLGSTIGVLIGSIFGSLAVAVSPLSGLQGGFLGKYIKAMTGFYLLRLMLPPAAAVITKVMSSYSTSTASGAGFFQGLSAIFMMFALLWVTGKVIGFAGDGVVAGAGTVSGLFDTGKRHGQSAFNMMTAPFGGSGIVRAGRQGYRGLVRQGRVDVNMRNNAAKAQADLMEHPTVAETWAGTGGGMLDKVGMKLMGSRNPSIARLGYGMSSAGTTMQGLAAQLPRVGHQPTPGSATPIVPGGTIPGGGGGGGGAGGAGGGNIGGPHPYPNYGPMPSPLANIAAGQPGRAGGAPPSARQQRLARVAMTAWRWGRLIAP